MILKSTAEQVLAAALRTGGDFAELFCEDRRSGGMGLVDGHVESASTVRRHGAGIRVYNGLNSVYVHTNDTSLSGLLCAARKAADAVSGTGAVGDIRLTRSVAANIHPIQALPMDVAGTRKAKLLRDMDLAARAVSPEIRQVRANLIYWDSDVQIANSEGLFIGDRRVYTRMACSAVAEGGGESQSGSTSPGAMMGFELFESRVDVAEQARIAADRAVTMLHAEPCPAGVMPVVIDGGFGGVIFHEACGHSLVDDGTLPGEWGSLNIDDEGTPTTRLVLIKDGVLVNYMVDRLNGRRMNMPMTGSSRRQDYTFAPTSRMRNTYIAAGSDDEGEIIATCGDGLYAKSMGGGSVNPVTGEFNFAVAEGWLIRDGKVDRPVRGATLIGRGAEVLKKIDRVGGRMWMAQGMCGASSGSIPTNVGQPMIRVTDMTVGGR